MSKKVYFVANQFDGCWYARCMQALIANGWWGVKPTLRAEPESQEQSAQGALAADIVVFHRPDDKARLEAAKLLKQKGKKVVYDNDDTYIIDNEGIATKIDEEGMKRIEQRKNILDQFMAISDLVTTTTEFLADEYRKINKNVLVLKNCVDPDDWPTPKRNEGEKVRIGLVGSVTANGDFDSIRVALTELNKRADVQLVMFGLPPKDLPKAQELYKEEYEFWSQFNIEWQPFVPMADYFDTLNNLRLDMMLIPRKDNYFNRCKSNIKFLEASMLEIPCVMQGFEDGKSPYQFDKVEEQGMGIVVTDNSKWLEAIDKLIANKDLRRAMGKLANKYVLENYDIKTNAINWKNAYENL